MLLSVGNNVRVEGVSFDGGGSRHPNAANVIQGYKVSNVTFDGIALRHTRGIGLLMSSDIVGSTIRNSIFEDLGNFWKISHKAVDRKQGVVFCCGGGNRGNAAINNRFSDVGLDALQFTDQSDVVVSGNRFNLENQQRETVKAPDYPAAIFLAHVNRATIQGNTVSHAQGSCIDAPGLTDAAISRNILTECGAAGLGLFDTRSYDGPFVTARHIIVSGNTITNNARWAYSPFTGGVTLGGEEVTDVLLSENIIANTHRAKTQKYGIFGVTGTAILELKIDSSNRLVGNAKAALGGTALCQVSCDKADDVR
jgi:hypothetical protein